MLVFAQKEYLHYFESLTSGLGGLQQILLLLPDNVALHLDRKGQVSERYVCTAAVA